MKSLQLYGRRQIAEPHKHCLVCVWLFFFSVYFLYFCFSQAWEFWINSLQNTLKTKTQIHVKCVLNSNILIHKNMTLTNFNVTPNMDFEKLAQLVWVQLCYINYSFLSSLLINVKFHLHIYIQQLHGVFNINYCTQHQVWAHIRCPIHSPICAKQNTFAEYIYIYMCVCVWHKIVALQSRLGLKPLTVIPPSTQIIWPVI